MVKNKKNLYSTLFISSSILSVILYTPKTSYASMNKPKTLQFPTPKQIKNLGAKDQNEAKSLFSKFKVNLDKLNKNKIDVYDDIDSQNSIPSTSSNILNINNPQYVIYLPNNQSENIFLTSNFTSSLKIINENNSTKIQIPTTSTTSTTKETSNKITNSLHLIKKPDDELNLKKRKIDDLSLSSAIFTNNDEKEVKKLKSNLISKEKVSENINHDNILTSSDKAILNENNQLSFSTLNPSYKIIFNEDGYGNERLKLYLDSKKEKLLTKKNTLNPLDLSWEEIQEKVLDNLPISD